MLSLVAFGLAAGVCALAVLTAVGAHERGSRWVLAALWGSVFPVTWVLWYAYDELPHPRHRPTRP